MVNFVLQNTDQERRLYRSRLLIGLVFVLGLMGILVARYSWLQVSQYQHYAGVADRNRVQLRPLLPRRALIYERTGQEIALNIPSASVMIVPELVQDLDALLAELNTMINLEDDEIKRFRTLLKKSGPSAQVPLKIGLSDEAVARVAVNQHRLVGMELDEHLVRYYPYNNLFAHAVGYLGAINTEELRYIKREKMQAAYGGTYTIGKIGLEQSYELDLHGLSGYDYVEVDVRGYSRGVINRKPAVRGKDLHLHLDINAQKAARDAMGANRGAVVALDVRNGGVVVFYSAPDFNPNDFGSGAHNALVSLQGSALQPLFNRAINGRYAPASTFKPIIGLAGLSGFVTKDFSIEDLGYYRLANRVYYDWLDGGHGHVDMHLALVESCDTYFYSLGLNMGDQPIVSIARQFGIGTPTGIDLNTESVGILPGSEWKLNYLDKKWFAGDTLNLSIGQGDLLMTPIQMAVMAMMLANRGKRWQPQLVRAVGEQIIAPKLLDEIDVPEEHWNTVQNALEGVVHEYRGTAHMIGQNLDYRIAGKTGTSQITSLKRVPPKEGVTANKDGVLPRPEEEKDKPVLLRDHAIFIGYAPAKEPTLAVAVIVENGRLGGQVAGPIARAVFDTWVQSEH